MTSDEPNLYITKSFVGRISNHGHLAYTIKTDQVLSILASENNKAIPGYKYDSSRLEGLDWMVSLLQDRKRIPVKADYFDNKDGSLGISFREYKGKKVKEPELDLDSDKE